MTCGIFHELFPKLLLSPGDGVWYYFMILPGILSGLLRGFLPELLPSFSWDSSRNFLQNFCWISVGVPSRIPPGISSTIPSWIFSWSWDPPNNSPGFPVSILDTERGKGPVVEWKQQHYRLSQKKKTDKKRPTSSMDSFYENMMDQPGNELKYSQHGWSYEIKKIKLYRLRVGA